MRLRALCLATLPLLAGAAAAEPLSCPTGAAPAVLEAPADAQRWCALRDGRRHGPSLVEGALADHHTLAWRYAEGLLDGPFVDHDARGRRLAEGAFHAGGRDGRWAWWTPSGKLLGEATLTDGTGRWLRVSGAGRRAELGAYRGGERDGHWVFWSDAGKRSQEGDYLAGRKQGRWTAWSLRGVVFREEDYDGGRLTGTRRLYHGETGRKLLECGYRGDRLDGACTEWYPSGAKRALTTYRAGRLDGPFATYYPDGKPREEGRYSGGKLDGPYASWSIAGHAVTEGQYRAGAREGAWRFHTDDGADAGAVVFHGGVPALPPSIVP
jgi:antitoxin component YwqK of YwqJK toxin-antitoxin module